MRIEFKNPVATVLVAWAAERTIKFIVKQVTMPDWEKAWTVIRDAGYDIVPKATKKEEEDLEKVDKDVVDDEHFFDEIDEAMIKKKEEK